MEFTEFPKLARLSRECVITEKIDGTNAQICITDEDEMLIGSRTRWITPESDNFGFARWAREHEAELRTLGHGHHFGEWWGNGIQRGYGLKEKRFSLFNTIRWVLPGQPKTDKQDTLPPCCGLVPTLYQGLFDTTVVDNVLGNLRTTGSLAAPGFMDPEGVVCFHIAAKQGFKKTLNNDAIPKSMQ